jgi:hypothetical protein
LPLRSRSSTRRESLRSNSPGDPGLNSKIAAAGDDQAKTEVWLPLVDALRNFVFDPSPDFLALIHGLRVDPLPGLVSL